MAAQLVISKKITLINKNKCNNINIRSKSFFDFIEIKFNVRKVKQYG